MIKRCEEKRRHDINARSRVDAIGWTSLFNGFLGEDEKHKARNWEELLPYQEDSEQVDKCRVSKATAEIYLRLLSQGLIPLHVRGAMRELYEEMQTLIEG